MGVTLEEENKQQTKKERIIELARTGKYTRQEIADKLGQPYSYVARVILEEDIDLPKQNTRPEIERKAVIKLAKTGEYTRQEIADKLELPYHYVSTVIREENIDLPKQSRIIKIPETKRKQVIELAKTEKYTRQEIADKLKLSYHYVTTVIREEDIDLPKQSSISKIPETKRKQVIELAETGQYTRQEITDKLQLSYDYVSMVIRKAKIKVPRQKKISEDARRAVIKLARTRKYTIQEIAEMLELSYKYVMTTMRDENIKPKRKITHNQEQIIKLAKTGEYTRQEIAEILGLSYSFVTAVILDENIDLPKQNNNLKRLEMDRERVEEKAEERKTTNPGERFLASIAVKPKEIEIPQEAKQSSLEERLPRDDER